MKKIVSLLLLTLSPICFAQNSSLNFDNKQDFEDARRGFIATWDKPVLTNEDGSYSYTLEGWDFLKKDCPETANKSLWRQSQLNSIHGLFEVVPNKIYQIRGFDLANMTFVKTDSGWLVMDVTSSKASAVAGYKLIKKHVGDFPIRAVLITHPHQDHFGGIEGIIENAPNKDFDIITPKGFLKHAQEENVIAGIAMRRRGTYMYGLLLPIAADGNIGSGLGQTNSVGSSGMAIPTIEIAKTGEKLTVDGLDMEFIYAPDAEAPVEIMVYFPQLKTFCTAEEINHTLHNLLTLRGALVRNGLLWSKHIDKAIQMYGKEVEVSFGMHHWPTWGNERILKQWKAQRDLYRYLHDQTLNLANKGYTPNEIAEEVKLPASLDSLFSCRGYYGTVSHNVKSQYQLYFGWYDGHPSNLNPLPPVEEGKRYVEAMGGAENVLKIADKAFQKEDFRWCATLLKHLVFAEPDNQKARNLLAETFKKLGYQSESGPWRNFYLTGAKELLSGTKTFTPKLTDVKMAMTLKNELLFDYIAIQVNGKLAAGKEAVVNVHFTDTNDKQIMMLSNGALSHRLGKTDEKADLSISLSKPEFVKMMFGAQSLSDIKSAGHIKLNGNEKALNDILSSMDKADPQFNIVLP